MAGHGVEPPAEAEWLRVSVDQVILANDPDGVVEQARALGLEHSAVGTTLAYDGHCVELAGDVSAHRWRGVAARGLLVARAGLGFAAGLHLERFASPARLALTDEPRLAGMGGAAMLTLVRSPAQIARALLEGSVLVAAPCTLQIVLTGRLHPFVSVQDAAIELVRREVGALVQRLDARYGAPVVLEFSGPSAKLLSVPERALLAAFAPTFGAEAAIFPSDEMTAAYLRDQRRSKSHRTLQPEVGAPCDEVVSLDLSSVEPLLLDGAGRVHTPRDLDGADVSQGILGGDSGTSLRDTLLAAALLRTKKLPPAFALLLAPASRQALEVLVDTGALRELLATGARIVEPDTRLLTGELYPAASDGLQLRTCSLEPGAPASSRSFLCSAETLASAATRGVVGDPRAFRRPVRAAVPRSLPSDDVLLLRKNNVQKELSARPLPTSAPPKRRWDVAQELLLASPPQPPQRPSLLLLASLDDVRWALRAALHNSANLVAVLASHIPSGMRAVFAGQGVATFVGDAAVLAALASSGSVTLPALTEATDAELQLASAGATHRVRWAARGPERLWTTLAGA